MPDSFSSGEAYEPLMGRWSEMVAGRFAKWLAIPRAWSVLDVGCGTGALSRVLVSRGVERVVGVDPSPSYVDYARSHSSGEGGNASFEVGNAMSLEFPDGDFDAVVSGLVLNFIPDPLKGVREMARVVRKGGVVAAYVWDYQEKFELARCFWDAAKSLDASADSLDEGIRFSICRPEVLIGLFQKAGLVRTSVDAIEIEMTFRDFDECWSPLLGRQGPIGGYLASLNSVMRVQVRDEYQRRLRSGADGEIRLGARAWAIKGYRPDSSGNQSSPSTNRSPTL